MGKTLTPPRIIVATHRLAGRPQRRILALDCATVTGWATNAPRNGRGLLECGVETFKRKKGQTRGDQFRAFRLWLEDLASEIRPEIIVFERASHRGRAAAELCLGLTTRVEEVAALVRAVAMDCPASTLKLFATGNGNAEKGKVTAAARACWGIEPADDNEADALMLLDWGLAGFPAREPATKRR